MKLRLLFFFALSALLASCATSPIVLHSSSSSQLPSLEETSSSASVESTSSDETETSTSEESFNTVEESKFIFNKVKDQSELISGTYLIVNEANKVALDGGLSSIDAAGNVFDVTISMQIISLDETYINRAFTYDADAQTLVSGAGYFIGAGSSTKNCLNSSLTTTYANSIFIENGVATITSNGRKLSFNENANRFRYYSASSNYGSLALYRLGNLPEIYPTSISLPNTLDLYLEGTATLRPVFTPVTTNQKQLVWNSSSPSLASVDQNGVVTAHAEGKTTITCVAKTETGTTSAATQVSVTEKTQDDYTILIYISGNDLESENGLASMDISEMLSVQLPEGINVVLQTGGAKKWSSTHGISASYLTRYHIANKKLVQDERLSKANMGQASTLQSFLTYGLTNFPANKTAVILWNHGGAMDGVCYDENYNDDALTAKEVKSAVSGAFLATGRTSKLEWIGYDACLMAVQDVASINADYFHYQISSQESEVGYGWDYDNWFDDLANNPNIDTPTLAKEICDTFYTSSRDSEATLSVLDLDKFEDYLKAWQNIGKNIRSVVNSSSKWSSFTSAMSSVERYGYDSQVGYTFEVYDAYGVLNKMSSSSSYNVTGVSAAKTALSDVVIYNKVGSSHSSSKGLSCYIPTSSYANSSVYTESDTKFSEWRTFVSQYGYNNSSYYW